MKSLDVDVDVDDDLLAQRTHRVILQVQRVLVTFHIAFARENFVTNVARKLTTFTLMDFRDVNS